MSIPTKCGQVVGFDRKQLSLLRCLSNLISVKRKETGSYIYIVTNLSDCLKTENFTENFIANFDLPKSLTMLSIQKV